jgi:hypothetical protein
MVTSSYGRRSTRIASLLKPEKTLLVCVLLGVSLVILWSFPLIFSRYQIDYGEGLMLEGALRMRHSQPLYPNPFSFPVVLHVYGPVAYTATATVLAHGGASFPAGRLLILGCSAGLALLISRILQRLTGSWWTALSFGFLLLTLPAFRFWLYLLRADVIGVLFSMIGVAIYVLYEKGWYGCIPFFGLALFCKYSLLAAPIAVLIHLLVNGKIRRGTAFAAGLGVAAGIAFMAFQIKTDGWFAFHMFSTHPDRYSLMQFFALAALVLASAPVATGLAAWYVAFNFRRRNGSFPPIYLAVSALTALTAGKLGSTTNHFIEFMVACCICAGMGYSLLLSRSTASALRMTVLLSASVWFGVVLQNRPSQQPSRELTGCSEAYQYVKGSPTTRVLSENLGPLLVAGKPIFVSDPFVYGQFVKHNLWPDQRIEDLVNARYFGMIVMSYDPAQIKLRGSDVWSNSLARAVERNYRTVNQFACRNAGVVLEPASPGTNY